MIRAIFFDIDGTLVSFDTHRIPESALTAMDAARAQGIKLFIASGRGPSTLQAGGALQEYPFDGYVTLNGQYCYTCETTIRQFPIPRADIRILLSILEEDPFPCLFVERDRCYINLVNEEVRTVNGIANIPIPPVVDIHCALEQDIYQLNFFLPLEKEAQLLTRLPNCSSTRWSPFFSDIIPTGGTKGVGMAKMLAHFGILPQEAMAFGDGGNDIEMLSLAGIGVAMGNAADNVKASADYVTTSVDEDGVYAALRHFSII